jgi:hypothetical protein
MPYQALLLPIPEVLDLLIANRPSAHQAGGEMIRAIEEGAITWLDPARDPASPDMVTGWVIQFIKSRMNWRPRTRLPIMPFADYIWTLRVSRERCEIVFALPSSNADQAEAELRNAPKDEIHKAITDVYDAADKAGDKPPNKNQLSKPVRALLEERGFCTSANRIKELSDEPQHKRRRRPVGKRYVH